VYAVVATLAFGLAAGAGAIGALMIRADLTLPAGEEPSDEQAGTPRPERQQTDAQQDKAAGQGRTSRRLEEETSDEGEQAAARQDETEYVTRVGDVQANAVTVFRDSHEKLLSYDALTVDDVEKMQKNAATLGRLVDETADLDPPGNYKQQYETFGSGMGQLHEAASLAHELAANPTDATQSGFDEYDSLVDGAAVDLERSNEALGRDYATIKGVQKVNPLS